MSQIKVKNPLLIVFFLIIVFADALTKIFPHSNPAPSAVIKGLLLIIPFVYVVIYEKRFRWFFLVLFSLFGIGCLTHSFHHFFRQIPQFFEYYFFIFFFIYFYSSDWKKIQKPLEWVFLIHAIIITVASVLSIKYLKTYFYSERFGYISFFKSQNEFSFILMAGLLFFYAQLKQEWSKANLLKLVFFFIAGFLVGTKAYMLFAFLFLIYLALTKLPLWLSISAGVGVTLVLISFSSVFIRFFENHYGELYNLYLEKGFISTISSTRSDLLVDRSNDYFAKNGFWNFLFGGRQMHQIFEISILDLFAFFGVLGVAGYISIIYKRIYKKILLPLDASILVIIIVLISMLSGYLIENASAQIYLLLTLMCFGSKPYVISGNKEGDTS